MIRANQNAQVATLTERDVGIEVQMGDITSVDFDRAPDAIELGRKAAQAMAVELSKYSVPEDEYLAWRKSVDVPRANTVQVADVRIVGLDRVNPAYVETRLKNIKPGAVLTTEQITEDTDRVFALGDFERVE